MAVVGGGLAGLAAALLAADSGADVVLLEARPRLGGATASFDRKGLWVDTGQHVFMRCCTAYRGYLARLGVEHLTTLQPRLDVEVLLGDRLERARLRRTRVRLPAPLHLAPALLGYRALPLGQRVSAALAALRIGRLDDRSPTVDRVSFGSWLAEHRQGPAATEALWELLTVATLNAPAAEASLALAAKVVRTGLLERADFGDIGWAEVPLQQLHGDASAKALAEAGADVRTSVKVRSITRTPAGGYELAVTTGGTARGESAVLAADAVVLAVPPPAAAALLPPGAHPDPASLERLGASPIVNIHMIFDRKVIDGPFLAVTGSPIQWIFDRTGPSGLARVAPPGAQYIALSQSAAAPWVDRPATELGTEFVAELRRVLPAARSAELLEVFVTRERTATFRQAPGSLPLRPGPATGLPGLALAGAWTDTGWPATMEGAVRSGLAAARETLASVGVDARAWAAPGEGASGAGRPAAVRARATVRAGVPAAAQAVSAPVPAQPAAPAAAVSTSTAGAAPGTAVASPSAPGAAAAPGAPPPVPGGLEATAAPGTPTTSTGSNPA
ncbi:MAG: FAD-dependent oxidoreductase [Frankia sp.]|nr:FAD-dependent oxidoreductase [Frankia sp.]